MTARITTCYIVSVVVGALWLLYAAPTLHTPFPGDWTALPVALSAFMLAWIALKGGNNP